LDDLRDLPRTAEVLTQATDRVMGALTDLVAELRHETPPTQRFDPRRAGVKLTGNPTATPRPDAAPGATTRRPRHPNRSEDT
ncbi:MAG: hypothetical protein ACRCYU_00070, partial [Nocardioides sp.]